MHWVTVMQRKESPISVGFWAGKLCDFWDRSAAFCGDLLGAFSGTQRIVF
jgi:hypothetical protein